MFLLRVGRTPYTQVVDLNWPGSYLLERLGMRLFGPGAGGLRGYDGLLVAVGCAAMVWLGGESWRGRAAGLGAGLLFLLIHLQDGVIQAGQRDFAMAVIALVAVAVLLRGRGVVALFTFEALVGVTVTIKPTLLPLALLPVVLGYGLRWRFWAVGMAGLAAALAVMFGWLWRFHAVGAFLRLVGTIGVLHGAMGRRPLGFLLTHVTSPLIVVFAVWVALLFIARLPWTNERKALLLGALCGLASYVAQGKGFPYQRYPFLAFALLLALRDFVAVLDGEFVPRMVAFCGLAVACLWIAPRSASLVHGFDNADAFEQTLSAELTRLQVQPSVGPGEVQCLDTYGGCIGTLYQERLVQSTGFLYDCYLFADASPVREAYRTAFLQAFDAARPRVLVVMDQFCFGNAPGFARITRWPELAARLSGEYTVDTVWRPDRAQRWWSRAERPTGFAVYVRK